MKILNSSPLWTARTDDALEAYQCRVDRRCFHALLWCIMGIAALVFIFITALQADPIAGKPYSDGFSAHPPSATAVPTIGILLPLTVTSASFTTITLSSLGVWTSGLVSGQKTNFTVLHASREPVVTKTAAGWDITFKPAP